MQKHPKNRFLRSGYFPIKNSSGRPRFMYIFINEDNIGKDYSKSDSNMRRTTKSFGSSYRPGPEDKSKKYVPGPGMY